MHYFLVAMLLIFGFMVYNIQNDLDKIEQNHNKYKEILGAQSIELRLIGDKLAVRDKERLLEKKINKNVEVFEGTTCLKCHNQSDTALPIRNIEISEAIEIVRNGTERSQAGQMPRYKSYNDGKSDFYITDSGLKSRFKELYVDEFLQHALSRDYQVR